MICRTRRDAPANLRGWALWLQVLSDGRWYEVCELRAADARQVLRWLDEHPERTNLRVMGVHTG